MLNISNGAYNSIRSAWKDLSEAEEIDFQGLKKVSLSKSFNLRFRKR